MNTENKENKENKVCAILLAAGSSTRMGRDMDGVPINKILVDICGRNPIEHCVSRFSKHVDEIVIVVSKSTADAARHAAEMTSVHVSIVMGGARRQDSVLAGIRATRCETVAIHDCARCMVSDETIGLAIKSAKEFGSGVAAVKMRDTVRNSTTFETVPRDELVLMQTPQCFEREGLLKAYETAGEVTDDAAIWQSLYGHLRLTPGSMENQKLTESNDIDFFRKVCGNDMKIRVGIGEDTHRLTEGRELILGGVHIPFRLGLLGHSDADVLVHAIIDALFGAAAMGDIGRHFSDKDIQYKGISSMILLERTVSMLKAKGFSVSNIDAVITAQEPKLAPHIEAMRKNIADVIKDIGIDDISIKATTPEHLGPEGNLESITARAIALVNGF